MFSDLDSRRRTLLEEFVTWRNLQALRAAANGAPASPRRTVRRPASRTAKVASRTSRARIARPVRQTSHGRVSSASRSNSRHVPGVR